MIAFIWYKQEYIERKKDYNNLVLIDHWEKVFWKTFTDYVLWHNYRAIIWYRDIIEAVQSRIRK